jgi:hypothetical protein
MLFTVDELGLELRDGYRWLRLVVQGQPLPNAEMDWDRDVLDTVVEVDTGVFRGSFGTTLWGHELANFRALLQALLDRLDQHLKASFALIEDGVEFDFELLRRGALAVQITVRPDTANLDRLAFELEVDPSRLTACVGQINAILSRFPPAITTSYIPDRDISPALNANFNTSGPAELKATPRNTGYRRIAILPNPEFIQRRRSACELQRL